MFRVISTIKARALLGVVLFLAITCYSAELLEFDSSRRIPFDQTYFLNTWHWDVEANTNEIHVFDAIGNLLPSHDETDGSANSRWKEADSIQRHGSHQTIAILDQGLHGAQVAYTASSYAPCATILVSPTSYGDADAAAKIMAWPADVSVANLSFGYTSRFPPTNVLNAIAARSNIVFVLAALNGIGPEDQSRDWLCLASLQNTICVTAFTHGDEIFGAYGTNVDMAAAGRRVPAEDSEYPFPELSSFTSEEVMGEPRGWWSVTGTSFAAPRVAAAASRLREMYPDETAPQIVERLCAGSRKTGYWLARTRCGALDVPRAMTYTRTPSLSISRDGLIVAGPTAMELTVLTSESSNGPWVAFQTVVATGWAELVPLDFSGPQRFFKL